MLKKHNNEIHIEILIILLLKFDENNIVMVKNNIK